LLAVAATVLLLVAPRRGAREAPARAKPAAGVPPRPLSIEPMGREVVLRFRPSLEVAGAVADAAGRAAQVSVAVLEAGEVLVSCQTDVHGRFVAPVTLRAGSASAEVPYPPSGEIRLTLESR